MGPAVLTRYSERRIFERRRELKGEREGEDVEEAVGG